MLWASFSVVLLVVEANLASKECAASGQDCSESNLMEKEHSDLLHDAKRHITPCYSPCINQGMYCREENDEIRCKKAKNCGQLTCYKGKMCVETADGPKCMNNVFPSCMDASCPEGMRCVELRIPSRDLCVSQCFGPDTYPIYDQYFCSSGFEICEPDTVCIESFQDGHFLTVICAPVGCSDGWTCPDFQLCIETPQHLHDFFKSICVSATNFEFGNESCDSFDKGCANGYACHDFTFKGRHIGTGCGPSGTTFTATSCAKLECPAMLECYQRIIDGRGGLAQCDFKHSVDIIAEDIKSLLEYLPDHETH